MAAHANASVVLDDRMPLERALTELKRSLLKRGIFKEMKAHVFYEKPSLKKRRKQTEARKKIRKGAAKRAALEREEEKPVRSMAYMKRSAHTTNASPKGR